MDKEDELKVFISSKESVCGECQSQLESGCWITLKKDKGVLCLTCGDLEELVYLPSGDAALTRRARKYSKLSAVVLKWSRSRKRYERQGLLVEEDGLEKAEVECLNDSDIREQHRIRSAQKNEFLDRKYIERFAKRVREMFPQCPPKREQLIAEHACLKYSGRVGRCAAAKELSDKAIRLAVIAHIRHAETPYDELLGNGIDRYDARDTVSVEIDKKLLEWGNSASCR